MGGTRFRGPAPNGAGRRSAFQAVPALVLVRRYVVRWAAPSGADRRSAFQAVPRACSRAAIRGSLGCAQRCRPEVGVPSRPRACSRWAVRGSLGSAQRCRPEVGVPSRSRACSRSAIPWFAGLRPAVAPGGGVPSGSRALLVRRHAVSQPCGPRGAGLHREDQQSLALPCERAQEPSVTWMVPFTVRTRHSPPPSPSCTFLWRRVGVSRCSRSASSMMTRPLMARAST